MRTFILDCKDGSMPPGTCKLIERNPDHVEKQADTVVLLDPPPTDDPDDPLNWPVWQRNVILAFLCWITLVAGAGNAGLGPAFAPLSAEFHISYAQLANISAWRELAMAVSTALIVPFASVWGSRHQYLIAAVCLFVGHVWNGLATNYSSFLGSQILAGLGQATFMALIGLSVADLYHVHHRGTGLAITTAVAFASGFATPLLSGLVTYKLGWRWVWNILGIMTFPALVGMVLFAPETSYPRQRRVLPIETRDSRDTDDSTGAEPKSVQNSSVLVGECAPRTRMSFARRLLPIQKRISNQSLFMLLFRPFISLTNPAVLWFVAQTCTPLMGTYMIAITIAITFPGPPLSFNPSQIGLMNVAGCVGSVVGLLICIVLSDQLIKLLAKLNNGIYEPEFRLLMAIPQVIIGFLGLYGFGIAASDLEKYGWFWPGFFFALEVASMVIATMSGSAYIVDGYNNIAIEAFTIFTIGRALFSFVGAGSTVGWLQHVGVRPLFTIIAFVQLGFCLTSIPLYIFGKRIRSVYSKLSLFQRDTV